MAPSSQRLHLRQTTPRGLIPHSFPAWKAPNSPSIPLRGRGEPSCASIPSFQFRPGAEAGRFSLQSSYPHREPLSEVWGSQGWCRQPMRSMRDRLPELRQRAAAEGDPHKDALCFDNPALVEDDASSVSRVLREAAKLWRALDWLEQLSESIDRTQQTVLCCTSEECIAREKQGLGAARAAFAREAVALQPQLGALPAVPDGGTGRAGPRVRQTQLWLLLRRYRAVLARHYARESRYRQRLKEQIERQAELAGIDLGAKDLDRLAESPEVPRIVGRDLEELEAKQHLGLAQARQRQLLELEAQMAELHGLFLQLEGLQAEQHGAADSVERHVLRTLDYVAQSSGEVKKAFKCQRPSRLSALLTAALSLCACCACLPCLGGALR